MLRKFSDAVRECYRLASQSRELALRQTDPNRRAAFFKAEDRWILLAQSYELVESLSDFSGEVRRFLGKGSGSDSQMS